MICCSPALNGRGSASSTGLGSEGRGSVAPEHAMASAIPSVATTCGTSREDMTITGARTRSLDIMPNPGPAPGVTSPTGSGLYDQGARSDPNAPRGQSPWGDPHGSDPDSGPRCPTSILRRDSALVRPRDVHSRRIAHAEVDGAVRAEPGDRRAHGRATRSTSLPCPIDHVVLGAGVRLLRRRRCGPTACLHDRRARSPS